MPVRRLARTAAFLTALLVSLPVLAQDAPEAAAPVAPAAKPAAPARPARKPAPKPAAAPVAAATPAASPAGWPPGASAVSEVYGDWTISCSRENDRRQCQLSQAQGDSRTGNRRFSIELQQPQDGRAQGLVLMPLGLSLEPGITFKLDDATLGKGAPYTTCVAAGCLAPISFPTVATDAMKTAVALRITGTKPNGEAETFSVPLAGFAAALTRVGQLTG
ncbi:invasion associated locus B family protein [Methylobacterium oryzihabitans]|uniref:Invasion associated locus B family protein n=1 Tax=Methylobacterium oryzihabitans TaxID=2499852 RepID=A0A3S2VVP4_9HYPH|nr:invasion associated locus B family protein [Methylobacterium oryzihabitans]RVU18707.1 invasion associated locus B family protein [Methylobacterium oryzihabitans]